MITAARPAFRTEQGRGPGEHLPRLPSPCRGDGRSPGTASPGHRRVQGRPAASQTGCTGAAISRSVRAVEIRRSASHRNTVMETRTSTTLVDRLDHTITAFLRRWSIPALRVSLGIVFVWFGAMKVFDVTPVADLVASTVYWFDPGWVVPVLGVLEVIVGVGLLFRIALRLVLALFAVQMVGTFLVLALLPEVSFDGGNPLLLTVEGEFVVKNLVLLSAGMVVGATVRRGDALAMRTATMERIPEPH